MIEELLKLTADNEGTIAKDALLAIVNISADEKGAETLFGKVKFIESFQIHEQQAHHCIFLQAPNLTAECIKFILDENCPLSDAWAMVLSNVSRTESLAQRVIDDIVQSEESLLEKLVSAFTRNAFNKKNCNLNYLGECERTFELFTR